MQVDMTVNVFDCPELPASLGPGDLSVILNGKESDSVFAIDTDQGVVKAYDFSKVGDVALDGNTSLPVEEIRYQTLELKWSDGKVSGCVTFQGN